ncbi:prolipoprotein diacylglyceryl transferase [Actinomyces vulturis]|uniref:prolipoprotein diacylglyceryl transferase n=1 Tax=Actinomyces vulturis TaxID=1857645 RepID=UPI000A69034B|nr:prolipoprotein diacylglyceryl transferase [Actinomyces vulturis]
MSLSAMMATSIPSPSQGVWHLGSIPLRAYALCILAGIMVAVWWSDKRYRADGGEKDVVLDVCLVAVPVGIIGARIYHVITSPDAYFGPHGDLTRIPLIWEGGLGIWGGVAAGLLAAWIYTRKRGINFPQLADAVAPTLLIAQAMGRFGNWFNQELFGAPTTKPWGLEIDVAHMPSGYAPGTLFHPTFAYEALWNLAGAAFLVWAQKRFHLHGGRVMWLYVVVYTSGRLWIEMLRIDSAQHIFGLRLNVWTSLIVLSVGLIGFVFTGMRQRAQEVEPSELVTR